ncbi:UNVERIFIED_CONTAM: hypothetical protein Sindi_1591000 [Sesamum indicum]
MKCIIFLACPFSSIPILYYSYQDVVFLYCSSFSSFVLLHKSLTAFVSISKKFKWLRIPPKRLLLKSSICLDCSRSPALKPSIFKVDDHLRIPGRDNDYDPEILSIGPYHHGKSGLQNMDQHKCWYLKQLLSRKNESVERYVHCRGSNGRKSTEMLLPSLLILTLMSLSR